jgi:hypothetical protein
MSPKRPLASKRMQRWPRYRCGAALAAHFLGSHGPRSVSVDHQSRHFLSLIHTIGISRYNAKALVEDWLRSGNEGFHEKLEQVIEAAFLDKSTYLRYLSRIHRC